jgi:hypothetical protein
MENVYLWVAVSFCGLIAIFAIILAYFLTVREENRTNVLIAEKLGMVESLKAEFAVLNGDIQRLKFEHYEDLLNKFKKLSTEQNVMDSKVLSVDKQLKDFYAKWAVRLGSVKKMIEAAKEESDNDKKDYIEYTQATPTEAQNARTTTNGQAVSVGIRQRKRFGG